MGKFGKFKYAKDWNVFHIKIKRIINWTQEIVDKPSHTKNDNIQQIPLIPESFTGFYYNLKGREN